MASSPGDSQERDQAYGPSKVKVTILASEWGSTKGGLSTVNRELAIQLAKCPEVEMTFFVPQCSEGDKNIALSHNITIVEATRRPGFEELEWLSFPPEHLQIDIIVGHGVKLGRQAQVIRDSHKCKWVQVVHTDPEEIGMFKYYDNPILKGEEKRNVEVNGFKISHFTHCKFLLHGFKCGKWITTQSVLRCLHAFPGKSVMCSHSASYRHLDMRRRSIVIQTFHAILLTDVLSNRSNWLLPVSLCSVCLAQNLPSFVLWKSNCSVQACLYIFGAKPFLVTILLPMFIIIVLINSITLADLILFPFDSCPISCTNFIFHVKIWRS